jgi:hypothetical protein
MGQELNCASFRNVLKKSDFLRGRVCDSDETFTNIFLKERV